MRSLASAGMTTALGAGIGTTVGSVVAMGENTEREREEEEIIQSSNLLEIFQISASEKKPVPERLLRIKLLSFIILSDFFTL